MRRLTALLFAAVAAAPLMLPGKAEAGLKFCNYYPHASGVYIAQGYRNNGCSGNYAKIGWYYAAYNTCTTTFSGWVGLYNRYWYYFAEATNGAKWSGPFVTGVTQSAFHKCWYDNTNVTRYVGFREISIDPWIANYTVNLIP
jgi:uncharacterized membrane protein